MKKYYLNNKIAGFSLVETLMAISILSLSVVATFTAVQTGIQNSTLARDQTTAFYLAQEAIEYIKNTRDQNALYSIKNPDSPHDWLYGLYADVVNDPCSLGKVCKLDSYNNVVTSCGNAPITTSPPGLCPNLNQNSTTGLFGYLNSSGWNPTSFKREIQMQILPSGVEVKVVVSVSWTSKSGPKSFQASEILFNHQ